MVPDRFSDRFTDVLGVERGIGLTALTGPVNDSTSRQAAALLEAWTSGQRESLFRALRACALPIRAGNAPAAQQMLEDAIALTRPHRTPAGRGLAEALCDLSGVRLSVCDYVLVADDECLHLWEDGDCGPRGLTLLSARTECGLPVAELRRAQRGAWMLAPYRQCSDCRQPKTFSLMNVASARKRAREKELIAWPNEFPLPSEYLPRMEERFCSLLLPRVQAHPERASEKWGEWEFSAYARALREAMARYCATLPDQRVVLARALGGRYEEGLRRRSQLAGLVESLARPPDDTVPGLELAELRLGAREWGQVLPRMNDLYDPRFPSRYADAVQQKLSTGQCRP